MLENGNFDDIKMLKFYKNKSHHYQIKIQDKNKFKLVFENFWIEPGFCIWNRDERKKGNKDECLSRFFGRRHIEIW